MRRCRRLLPLSALGALAAILVVVAAAGAAGGEAVRCTGDANYCEASVNLGGGASNRVVTVQLTASNLNLVGSYAVPGSARRAFGITDASYQDGGTRYRFRLNALESVAGGARAVLLFGPPAQSSEAPGIKPLKGWHGVNALFKVDKGMTVSIVGGGGGTSYCTTDETNTTFVTQSDREDHSMGLETQTGGDCGGRFSWSEFRITLKDPSGAVVGSGVLELDQDIAEWRTTCLPINRTPEKAWWGLNCHRLGEATDGKVEIEQIDPWES